MNKTIKLQRMSRVAGMLLVMLLTTTTMWAETIDLSTVNEDFTAENGVTLTGTLNSTVKISIADGATVTLSDAKINGTYSNDYLWAGITCLGDATIILADGTTNSVKSFGYYTPGIYVPSDKTLTIRGNGELNASSNFWGAGIGGSKEMDCGNIRIEGGTITATGSSDAAGIGSGQGKSCGDITICGGSVIAKGGHSAAGIGSSPYGSCGNISISGGTVTANGGSGATGIGSGYIATCGTITISGGTVTATGGKNAAGIGLAESSCTCGDITITDEVISVTAKKGENALYSIGKGGLNCTCGTITICGDVYPNGISESPYILKSLSTITSDFIAQNGWTLKGTLNSNVKISIADGATVTLSGVKINGINNISYRWAGITCIGDATIMLADGTTNSVRGFSPYFPGIYVPSDKTLIIQGSGTLNASSNGGGAGIGGGQFVDLNCGNIRIEGGTVTATGGNNCAGIGSGQSKSCGDITICGGSVTATGGSYSSGIGCGDGGTCGTITISGGTVKATGGMFAAGIGCGDEGTCGDITISEGVICVIVEKGDSSPCSIGNGKNGGTYGTITIGGDVYSNGISVSPYIFPERHINLADGTAYTYAQDYLVSTATYTKTIVAERVGKYQGWLVPFDYTIKANDTQKFTFYKINMIANSPSPTQETTNEMWVFLTRLSAGDVLHANMPYVYKPLEAVTDYPFTTAGTTLKAMNTGVIAKVETMEDVYSFYATYQNTTATAADPFYYVNINGEICLGNNGSLTVGPYRWIIRKTSKTGSETSYAPQMSFYDGEEETTDIRPANATSLNGENWYDLQGRKLDGKPEQRGVYVVNGKKIVIR